MKKLTGIFTLAIIVACGFTAKGQAFRKGSFDINLSEGWTYARYNVSEAGTNTPIGTGYYEGKRDPLAIEYGISKHWGIGLSTGYDIYQILPGLYYPCDQLPQTTKATSSEFTFDVSYHFFVTNKLDLAAVLSLGGSSVIVAGLPDDDLSSLNTYKASGGIIRLGLHARYYFSKHFGLLGIASIYSSSDAPGKDDMLLGYNSTINTTLKGSSFELGFCFRFKK